MTCAASEDSDQSVPMPSLISVLAVRMKKPWVLSYLLSAQRRVWSDWADAQTDMCLGWAHMSFCVFCHAAAHLSMCKYFSFSFDHSNCMKWNLWNWIGLGAIRRLWFIRVALSAHLICYYWNCLTHSCLDWFSHPIPVYVQANENVRC